MSDTATLDQPIVENAPSPFDMNSWKSEPTPISETKDPVIIEKDEKIKEEKPTSDKPNDPEKIPGANPPPIQDRPEVKDENTKEAVSEPLKFANDESERIFNLLKEGKKDEVYNILSEQRKLSEVDKLPAADIIKLNLQYQNKDFTPQEINDLFEETYTMPEKPEQRIEEDDDDFKERSDKYDAAVKKIESRISRDSKPAINQLQKLQKEIVIPDLVIDQKPKEPTQEELAAQKVSYDKYLDSVDKGLKSFKGYETTFKDEEVELKAGYKPTEEEKTKLTPLLQSAYDDLPKFFDQLGWLNKGEVNLDKMVHDLHLIQNQESILAKIASETGTQRRAEAIKSIKNVDYNGGKGGEVNLTTPQQEQKKMAAHFFSA